MSKFFEFAVDDDNLLDSLAAVNVDFIKFVFGVDEYSTRIIVDGGDEYCIDKSYDEVMKKIKEES